jgi:hypothetical protein
VDTLSKLQEFVRSSELSLSAQDTERLSRELYNMANAWMQQPPTEARKFLRRAKKRVLKSFRPKVERSRKDLPTSLATPTNNSRVRSGHKSAVQLCLSTEYLQT